MKYRIMKSVQFCISEKELEIIRAALNAYERTLNSGDVTIFEIADAKNTTRSLQDTFAEAIIDLDRE